MESLHNYSDFFCKKCNKQSDYVSSYYNADEDFHIFEINCHGKKFRFKLEELHVY